MTKQVQEACIVAATHTPVFRVPRGMFRRLKGVRERCIRAAGAGIGLCRAYLSAV